MNNQNLMKKSYEMSLARLTETKKKIYKAAKKYAESLKYGEKQMKIEPSDIVMVYPVEEFYSRDKNRLRSDIHPELLKDLNLYGPYYKIKKIDGNYVETVKYSDDKLNAKFHIDLIKEVVLEKNK